MLHDKRRRIVASAVGVVVVVSLTLFTVGLVFIINKKCSESVESLPSTAGVCKYSDEAVRSGLVDLLANVRRTYEKVNPRYGLLTFSYNNPVPSRAYLDPSNIKDATDSAKDLLKQLHSIRIDTSALKTREVRGLAELEHFLEHSFGQAEDGDYYSGSWMLGPNLMCADYMCRWFKYHVYHTAIRLQPKTVQDVLKIRDALDYYNKTIHQYMDNIRYGVRSGMVRSSEACLAGFDSIKAQYLQVAQLNATGVLKDWFVQLMLKPKYYSKLGMGEKSKWLTTYGKSVKESIQEFLVEYIGRSLEKLLRFLGYDNVLNCVPSRISSGLANLPLSHIYFNGTKTDKNTVPLLPTGEKLNGRSAYKKSLAFYTTTNMTADEVYELGWQQVNLLYPQILELAKNVTGHQNESLAIQNFLNRLTNKTQYYNEKAFPLNESFAEARKNCLTVAKAKMFCPERWQALQIWFDEEAKLMSKLDSKTCNLFHFTGLKRTTPNCPIQMIPSFNPALAAPTYRTSGSNCRRPAKITLPFFNDNYGPRYQGVSINAHEGRPGHHTQLQGYLENFESNCPKDDLKWLDALTKYSAFSEGWGLYAEYPLVPEYTDAYKNEPLSQYGMLKGQIWRALRLVVDTGLHYKGMKTDEALGLFNKYMWDTSDVVAKEITRYQSVPGQALSYKIGQLTFMNLQNYARKHLGAKFNLRDFHYELLRHGSVPLDYIKYQVKKYVACNKDEQSADCKYVWTAGSSLTLDSNDRDNGAYSEYKLDLQEILELERFY